MINKFFLRATIRRLRSGSIIIDDGLQGIELTGEISMEILERQLLERQFEGQIIEANGSLFWASNMHLYLSVDTYKFHTPLSLENSLTIGASADGSDGMLSTGRTEDGQNIRWFYAFRSLRGHLTAKLAASKYDTLLGLWKIGLKTDRQEPLSALMTEPPPPLGSHRIWNIRSALLCALRPPFETGVFMNVFVVKHHHEKPDGQG